MEQSRKQEEIIKMERVHRICTHPLYVECMEKNRQEEMNRIFCGHDMQHFLDVARIGWILCLERKLNISKEMMYAAAFLHDIGRGMQYREGVHHDEASVLLAGHILPECGFSAVQTKEICDAIAGHRMSNGEAKLRTDLGEILEKADHASRCCFACEAEHECYWPKEKKNLEIRM